MDTAADAGDSMRDSPLARRREDLLLDAGAASRSHQGVRRPIDRRPG